MLTLLINNWWFAPLIIGGAFLFIWLSSIFIPTDLPAGSVIIRAFLFLGIVGVSSYLATLFGPGRDISLNIIRTRQLEQLIGDLSSVVEKLRGEKRGEVNNLTKEVKRLHNTVNILWQAKLPYLVPIGEMEKMEEGIETVWVFSRALNEDRKIYKKIYKNLSRGVDYRYMIPPDAQGGTAEDQLNWLMGQWTRLAAKEGTDPQEILGHVEKILVNFHCFVATVIVYDAAKDPKVIIKLPSDLPQEEYSSALQIKPKHKDAINNVIRCLQDLSGKKCLSLEKIVSKQKE